MILPKVRTFVPELWGQVDIFQHFYSGTHTFKEDTKKAIPGIKNHFQKAITLYQLANKLLPNLSIDEEEMQRKGFTEAVNAQEFSAVLEEVFTELYSSIDCTRKVIVSIYQRTRKLKDSTRKLFQDVRNNLFGDDFPADLKKIIKEAEWYFELLAIRDELTHSDIGYCRIDKDTQSVTYTHTGINREGKPLIIENVIDKINFLIESVNIFLGAIFLFLNSKLKVTTVATPCGLFYGRCYLRMLSLEPKIDFNSGVCQSHIWFDSDPQLRCHLAESCGAYSSAKSGLDIHQQVPPIK
jgi:hypothetical protein